MEGIPGELIVVGGVIVLAVVAVLVAKFGKVLLILLALAGVALAVIVGLALLRQPAQGGALSNVADIARVIAPKPEPEPTPAKCYPGGAFASGVLTTLGIEALGVIGYFWLRWKLAERGNHSHVERRQWKDHARPTNRAPDAEPSAVLYIVDEPGQPPVDPTQWGW